MNPCTSGRSVSLSDWPEHTIAYFAKLISNILWLVDRGPDPRHGIWTERPSMPCLSVYNIRIYSKVEDYETKNKTRVDIEYEWEKMAAAST